jgi:hypothetical protein
MQSPSAPSGSYMDSDADHAAEPLRSKLCRYLFPRKLLKQPHGDVFLQNSILRDNVTTLRLHSGHYFRVHAVLTGLLLLLVAGAAFGAPVLAIAGLTLLVPEIAVFVLFASVAIAMRIK